MEHVVQVPVQITFRDMPVSDTIESLCWSEAESLGRLCERLSACRVVLSARAMSGNEPVGPTVHIDLLLPGAELAVTLGTDHHRGPEVLANAIREAFEMARGRMAAHLGSQQGGTRK